MPVLNSMKLGQIESRSISHDKNTNIEVARPFILIKSIKASCVKKVQRDIKSHVFVSMTVAKIKFL